MTKTSAAVARSRATSRGADRSLEGDERRRLAMLGLPTFGLALAITTVSAYLPVVATGFTSSSTTIGVLIGAEGLLALFVPLLVGVWSDRLDTKLGGRLPFLLCGTPVMVVGLLTMGLAGSLLEIGIGVAVFFTAYFVAYEPYRALYPDLFPDSIAGRAQGNQAAWRGFGTILALVAGGILLSAGTLLPFAAAAIVLIGSVAAFTLLMVARGRLRRQHRADTQSARETAAKLRRLVAAHPALRAYLAANALWELSLGALKTFMVLYITKGLGYSLRESSLIIGAVAVVILVGALASGKIGDRIGKLETMRWGLWSYGITLAVPIFTTAPAILIAAVPVIAFGGGMIMGLPYALLMPLMPESDHGSLTGFYAFSRGLGTMLGPLLAGLAIALFGGGFPDTSGYAAMWIVCSGAILASIPLLALLRSETEDRRRLRRG